MTIAAAVLLAAGQSRRMSVPKQLLPCGNSTLLGNALLAAQASACSRLMVVVGAHQDLIEREVRDRRIEVVRNPDWSHGIATSVRAAVRAIAAAEAAVDAAVFLPVDQPLVSTSLIDRMIDIFASTRKPIVATQIGRRLGVPALFAARVFPELGRFGARQTIRKHLHRVKAVPFPGGALDIDTPEDYLRWREQAPCYSRAGRADGRYRTKHPLRCASPAPREAVCPS
jgi:molybdenum cofactor cytidylyltransferase